MKCTVRRFTGASGIHNGGVMYTTVQWRAVRATVVHYAECVHCSEVTVRQGCQGRDSGLESIQPYMGPRVLESAES